ncbi:MAG: L-threonylcarbamoyladenylate synthase [Salibacteraceae bacterium]|jgi:L-threonylcarbamoyladenylate synthase
MAVIGKDIKEAKEALENGGLVAIPTETVYGLAANAFKEESVIKIFEAKKRPSFDPLIVHVSSLSFAEQIVEEIPDSARKLAKAYWPGPLTLVLKKNDKIPLSVTSGMDTVGVRVPNHPLSLQLIKSLDFPLAAPSANPFGYTSPTQAFHVNNQLGNSVDYILDGGNCKVGIESTIVSCLDGKVVVLRLGGITVEEIEKTLGSPVDEVMISSDKPNAPGMLTSHYNPGKKVIIGNIDHNLRKFPRARIGVLSFKRTFKNLNITKQVALSPKGDMQEAAKNLFGALRKLDSRAVEFILTEEMPNEGLGRAINDRLLRASQK